MSNQNIALAAALGGAALLGYYLMKKQKDEERDERRHEDADAELARLNLEFRTFGLRLWNSNRPLHSVNDAVKASNEARLQIAKDDDIYQAHRLGLRTEMFGWFVNLNGIMPNNKQTCLPQHLYSGGYCDIPPEAKRDNPLVWVLAEKH